jgi:dTDP-4-amino-4,6-dideoxygalactose transaminase
MYTNARAWTYDVLQQGGSLPHGNLHAAIGLSQLAQFAGIRASRQALCRRYYEELASVRDRLRLTPIFNDVCPSCTTCASSTAAERSSLRT